MVEMDVIKLHNRIKMLQTEEEKALKKIDETRKKAKQMIAIKLSNEQQQKEKEELEKR